MEQESLVLTHDMDLTVDAVIAVSAGRRVAIESETLLLMEQRRAEIVKFIRSSSGPAYGFNRGFGHNVDRAVSPELLETLQLNFVRSHACGVGPSTPKEVVRAAMLLRIRSLIKGHSGVRPEVVKQLEDYLNNDVVPVVPQFGSVGASGDLAPLAHIALCLIGEGTVLWHGSEIATEECLLQLGLKGLRLEMKEGLALTNGMQFSLAFGVLALNQADVLLKNAAICSALSLQVMLGSDGPFEKEFQLLRPHGGALRVAQWIYNLTKNSPLREAHRNYHFDGEVQDPYNLRCTAQILGACSELLDDAHSSFAIEMNSATDNPLLLPDEHGGYTRIVSGGHFHGMPVATRMYGIFQALGIISSLSNTRCARYVDQFRNKGLGSDLIWPQLSRDEISCSSGMMIPEYVSAALTNFVLGQAAPSHLYSLPTDAGQEDHVSMAAGLAVRLWNTLPRVAEILAIEMAFARQAAMLRKEASCFPSKMDVALDQVDGVQELMEQIRKKVAGHLLDKFDIEVSVQTFFKLPPDDRCLSSLSELLLAKIDECFPVVKEDRVLSKDLMQLAEIVQRGDLVELAVAHGMEAT